MSAFDPKRTFGLDGLPHHQGTEFHPLRASWRERLNGRGARPEEAGGDPHGRRGRSQGLIAMCIFLGSPHRGETSRTICSFHTELLDGREIIGSLAQIRRRGRQYLRKNGNNDRGSNKAKNFLILNHQSSFLAPIVVEHQTNFLPLSPA